METTKAQLQKDIDTYREKGEWDLAGRLEKSLTHIDLDELISDLEIILYNAAIVEAEPNTAVIRLPKKKLDKYRQALDQIYIVWREYTGIVTGGLSSQKYQQIISEYSSGENTKKDLITIQVPREQAKKILDQIKAEQDNA